MILKSLVDWNQQLQLTIIRYITSTIQNITNQKHVCRILRVTPKTGNWHTSHYGTGLWFVRWLSFWSWQLINISRMVGCFTFTRCCPAIYDNHCLMTHTLEVESKRMPPLEHRQTDGIMSHRTGAAHEQLQLHNIFKLSCDILH